MTTFCLIRRGISKLLLPPDGVGVGGGTVPACRVRTVTARHNQGRFQEEEDRRLAPPQRTPVVARMNDVYDGMPVLLLK